ncbi:MAG: hypothetical protein JRI73_04635 [Deltaproteobacteria bacterium]|nr:hypothetical protein [Deltaproteobacteria bacterium]
MPHPKWLEVPKAYVVLKPGETLTAEEIKQHCIKKWPSSKAHEEN